MGIVADPQIAAHFEKILERVDPDPLREGLGDTPVRFAKAIQFMTSGYHRDPMAIMKSFDDGGEDYDQMVFQSEIPVWSLCEHHVLPFFGTARIGYLPNKRIVGLSKLSRLVEVFARRLQVQERLTSQIATALEEGLAARGVGVVLECRHCCMECRGVQKQGTITRTTALRGLLLRDESAKSEFLQLCR